MIKLKQLDGTELTEYTVQLLMKNNIRTVREFLDATCEEPVNQIIPEPAIKQIRTELIKKYGPSPSKLREQHNIYNKSIIYGTGIQCLDDMFSDFGFSDGSVWEFCGVSGIGKTQICHTIALNFAHRFDKAVLYIDTKLDFSGTRLMQMMRSRQLTNAECGQIMQQILVERTSSTEGVMDVLKKLQQGLAQKDEAVSNIKLIVIDAISAVWFLNRVQKDKGYGLLTKLSHLIWLLARQYQLAFVLTNLFIPHGAASEDNQTTGVMQYTQGDSDDADEYDTDDGLLKPNAPAESLEETDTHQVLGRTWNCVPHARLLLEQPQANEEVGEGGVGGDSTTGRTIRIVKSCYTQTGGVCHINITSQGVISS